MTSTEDEYEIRSKFQQKLDYESVILQQMGRISQHRSKDDLKSYQISIETLVLMLPNNLRKKVKTFKKEKQVTRDLSSIGRKKYDKLWEYINQLLEEDNLIYHTKYVKSYS